MGLIDPDVLDSLTDKLSAAGKVISGKAKEVAGVAKTNVQIAQEEKRLRTAYRELGVYIFEKSGIEADEAMAPYFEAISEAKANIDKLKSADEEETEGEDDEEPEPAAGEEASDAAECASEQVCPTCKSVISAQLIYCPNCGMKVK